MRRLPLVEHNSYELDAHASPRDVIAAANQTPFLCEKRMVIARGIVGQASRSSGRRRARSGPAEPPAGLAELLAYVPELPPTTHLVLVEDDPSTLQPFATADPQAVRKDFPRMR